MDLRLQYHISDLLIGTVWLGLTGLLLQYAPLHTDDGKLLRRFYKEKAGWSQWALLSDRAIS